MTTYQKVVRLLGKDFAAILELCKKLFITWNLDSKKFFSTINHLKKEQVIGLLDGTYEVVRKVKADLFIFNNFFKDQPGLYVWNMQRISPAYPNLIPYKSIENLKPAFELAQNMSDTEIIKKLGGKEEVRKTAITMDQIEQLIKAQWGGKAGIILNNGYANIFYVIGRNNELFAVNVNWSSGLDRWRVLAYELDEGGDWSSGDQVFSNKGLNS